MRHSIVKPPLHGSRASDDVIKDGDTIEICLYNFNKLFANKLIGRFVMVLQQVVKDGQLEVEETLLDDNNSALPSTIRLTVTYQAPDGTVGSWRTEDFRPPGRANSAFELEEEQQMLDTRSMGSQR